MCVIVPFLNVTLEFFNNWNPLLVVPLEPTAGAVKIYLQLFKSKVMFLSDSTTIPDPKISPDFSTDESNSEMVVGVEVVTLLKASLTVV